MPRPCECDRDGCRPCWLARHDARYRQRWGIAGEPEPTPAGTRFRAASRRISIPCVHLGASLTGLEREQLGLSHSRIWHWCAKEHGTQGAVCGCRTFPAGCRGCPDFEADDY